MASEGMVDNRPEVVWNAFYIECLPSCPRSGQSLPIGFYGALRWPPPHLACSNNSAVIIGLPLSLPQTPWLLCYLQTMPVPTEAFLLPILQFIWKMSTLVSHFSWLLTYFEIFDYYVHRHCSLAFILNVASLVCQPAPYLGNIAKPEARGSALCLGFCRRKSMTPLS